MDEGALALLLAAAGISGGGLVLLSVITLLAAIIRGYAGFGFSAIVVASTSLFIPTREAVPLVLVLEICASLQMARQIWRHINWRLIGFVLMSAVFFIPLGQLVLRGADVNLMRVLMALLLLAVIALLATGRTFPIKNAPPGWLFTGMVSGFMNGMLAMGGMWVVVCLINSGISMAALRASLVALFFLMDGYAISVASLYGLVDSKLLVRVAFMLPFMLVGIKIGAGRFDPEREQTYKKMVLGLLALLALLLIVRGALALI